MKLQCRFFLLAVLAWAAVTASEAFAEAPGTPQNLTASWQWSYVDNGGLWMPAVALHWYGNTDGGMPSGFRVYHAPGEKEDYDGFELMEGFKRHIWDSTSQDGEQRIVLGHWMGFGSHSFYVESYNEDGTSNPGNIASVAVPDTFMFYFSEYPGLHGNPAVAAVGENFMYQVGVWKSASAPIRYSLSPFGGATLPDGLTIDENTGVINWTPDVAGDYYFIITARLEGMPGVVIHATSYIRVLSCPAGAIISGLVKDEDGNAVSSGYVLALPVSTTDSIRFQPESAAIQSDGSYELKLNDGSYYLYFEGGEFQAEYYEDAANLKEAETVEAVCGQTVTVNATVRRLTMYTASGRVADYEGNGINARVVFIGYDLNKPDDMRRHYPRYFETYASAYNNGRYSLQLEDGYEYIAYAQLTDTLDPGRGRLVQAVQFFDHVEDYTEAEVLVLTGDRNDINFDFPQLSGFENSVAGRVVNSNSEAVNAYVVINRVKESNENADEWFGISTMTGSDGSYYFQDLRPGQYIVAAYPMGKSMIIPGYYNENGPAVLSWTESTRLVIGAQTEKTGIDIILQATDSSSFGDGTLRGSVYGDGESIGKKDDKVMNSDMAVAGAFVTLTDSKGVVTRYNLSGADGAFALNELAEGTYTLLIDKIGFAPYTTTVTISGSEPVQIDATLQPEVTTGVGETSDGGNARLYPNPVANGATLTFPAATGTAQVSVVSVTGTEVLTFRTATVEGPNTLYIDTQVLPTGTYFVRITTGDGIYRLSMRVVR